jgi:NADPH2:quinone reductase
VDENPLMRAIQMTEFGPPEVLVLRHVDAPAPGPGEALIDVALANVTFVETAIRAGRPPNPAMAPALPAIPGNGVGGTVAAVGQGADAGLIGTRVVCSLGGSGGYAEQVVVAVDSLIAVPVALELADAVALLADGRTALTLMETGAVTAGDAVLVEAAAGGVGTLLVQLAKAAGARVVAAAGGERKLEIARGLGADVVVDYRRDGWADDVEPVDAVFDGVGGAIGAAAFGRLRSGGRYVPFGAASGSFAPIDEEAAAERGVTVRRGGRPDPARMQQLSRAALDAAVAGRLRPVIGQRFPLERAADAHRAIETRATVGKTLLEVR